MGIPVMDAEWGEPSPAGPVILFSAEVASDALRASKGTFIIAVLAVAIPSSVSRRRLPKIPLILGAGLPARRHTVHLGLHER